MPQSSIGLTFTITPINIAIDIDLNINVKWSYNYLRHGTKLDNDEIGISYVRYSPINSIANVDITDLTSGENGKALVAEDSFTANSFCWRRGNSHSLVGDGQFLITDVYAKDALGNFVPYYYVHDLTSIDAPTQVEVLDANFNPVIPSAYAYFPDRAEGGGELVKGVYTNLKSSYDAMSNSYQLYYVRYVDDGISKVELLNAQPLYHYGTDIKSTYLREYLVANAWPDEWSMATITVSYAPETYGPTGPNSPTFEEGDPVFWIKSINDNRVYLEKPSLKLGFDSWYPRINNGEFRCSAGSITISVGTLETAYDQLATYYVPEFTDQSWLPMIPYKQVSEQRIQVVNERLVFIDPHPVVLLGTTLDSYVYIVQRDKNNQPVLVLTNNPDDGIYVDPLNINFRIPYIKSALSSNNIAKNNIYSNDGFVQLNYSLNPSLDTYASYQYVENYYEYTDIDINPALSPTIRDKKIVFYCIPEFSYEIDGTMYYIPTDHLSRSIHHLVIDDPVGSATSGNIVAVSNKYISTIGSITEGNPTITVASTAYIQTGVPVTCAAADQIDTDTVVDTVLDDTTIVLSKAVLDTATGLALDFNSSAIFVDMDYDTWKATYLVLPYYYVLLGEIRVNNHVALKDLNIFDTRVQGGGIKNQNISEAIILQPSVSQFFDIGYWDGHSFPGVASLLVRLPESLLTDPDNPLTTQQVESVVSKHMADGSFPLIQYYTNTTEVIDIVPADSSLTVTWKDTGAGIYHVYCSYLPSMFGDPIVWTRPDPPPLEVSQLITGLTNNRVVYIKVVPVIDGQETQSSRIIRAMPCAVRT